MSSQYPREKNSRTGLMGEKRFLACSVEAYLVRYPDGRVHNTIQDHTSGALHILSTVLTFERDQTYLGKH